ncbi:Uncharacterized protein Adt_42577 [Abeliophyllum distichum]|uniref:Uncharacterized protein n=1 Tax=Abeliophyllum distichum TaxID=126358 RepID=A0ABD1PS27_9LAMI
MLSRHRKTFEVSVHLSSNQLTLSCLVLPNIIAHIIVPRKVHLDEVNHYDVFLLDSIFREQDGQRVAKTKGFDDESGPSTLPFEGEDIDVDEDEPLPRPRSQRPPSSSASFTFTEDHYNLLNGQIDSLTSTAEGLRNSMVTLQDSVAGMTSLLHALHPPPEN